LITRLARTDAAAVQTLPSRDLQSTRRGRQVIRLISALSLGATVYGLLLWVYVAICGIVVPYTLSLPLTHLIPFLREDTSGDLGFAISSVGFIVYHFITHRPRFRGTGQGGDPKDER
jgi:hypothetical protein